MREQRRDKRKPIDVNVEVINTMTGESFGHIGNISMSGLMLIVHQPVCDNGLYQVQFALPASDADPVLVEIGIQEQWHESAHTPGQIWAGFRIIDIAPQHDELIKLWAD